MADRYNGFVVILDRDVRDDDAQKIIDAIKMIKGVQDVFPNIANPATAIATSRAKHEIMERIYRNILEDTQ